MSASRRTSTRPPPPEGVRTASAQVVADLLKRNHKLEVPTSYLIVVEGTTDCYYLRRAAELVLAECGVDLLRLDAKDRNGGPVITVCTPINPDDPSGLRGGLPQIERLARDVLVSVIEYELPSPICMLLDHDEAGLEAAKRLRDLGFRLDRAKPELLDPKSHPHACRTGVPSDPLVIEDLLSVRVQRAFLESTRVSCDVTYVLGEIMRIGWHREFKAGLCDFVCKHAEVIDVIEIVRALVRVRLMWRLDVPPQVNELLCRTPPRSGSISPAKNSDPCPPA